MIVFDEEQKKKAIEMYNEGMAYKDIQEELNVKGSTLRMFVLRSIERGVIKKRIKEHYGAVRVRQKLKEVRRQKKMTQKQVAEQIGINRNSYSNIENYKKNPSFRLVKKIKKVLDYYNDDLFDVYEDGKNSEKI
jgi:DNA-binding XRE family transcriptional regulator